VGAVVVCHCEVVSDADLRAAIAEGARDLDTVTDRCGAAGRCGGCIPVVEDLLEEARLAMCDLDVLLDRQAARRQLTAA
jgi:bacterioferritin-associated ferredoxin